MSLARDISRKGLYLLAIFLCLVNVFSAFSQENPESAKTQEEIPVLSASPTSEQTSLPPDEERLAPEQKASSDSGEVNFSTSAISLSPAEIVTATQALSVVATSTTASSSANTDSALPKEEKHGYFNEDRRNVLVIVAILIALVAFFTYRAQRGKELFIRRISGLSAIDDAVGRATEMGRGVLFVPGIMDMDDIQTIAGVTILGHVAKKTAEYNSPLFAPMTRSFVMSVAQEVVKQSYLEKGRSGDFRADRINYLTDDQFGYVAGVGGLMNREKPAACFYLGTFYAESLILAETGHSVGAIQIAGTAEPSQIPFFVAACDYTLIGEELFAASAYLSRNPREVGSLKGQDISKLVIIFIIILGTVLMSVSQSEWGEKSGGMQKATEAFMDLLKAK
ncbi:hypothetical protein HYY75_06390 [bacterium]|nr:hypothetical protein [bacterium]